MLVFDACESFLEHCQSAVSLSVHTLRAYRGDLKCAKAFFGSQKVLENTDKDDLRGYIRHLREEKGFKESSIKRRIACLKLLFRWAIQESLIVSNPFDRLNERIRLPKRLPRALDTHHVRLLRKGVATSNVDSDFCDICNKTAILLLLETGIRIGELTTIRVEDVSLSDRRITIHGKGNRQRLVYLLSASIYRPLSQYLARREKIAPDEAVYLFITPTGRSVRQHEIRASLREIVAETGIERHVTPHMLRHTCATQWLESGLDIRFVQKLLGHHSISTTEIYTHVSDLALRDALMRANKGGMR